MIEYIKNTLLEEYGLPCLEIHETRGGWSASAFIAYTPDRAFFIKAYDKRRPSARPWIDRMALYLPVISWLDENTPLKNSMVVPIPTKNNVLKAENENLVMLVFPLIKGETLGETRLNGAQIRRLSDILAMLHSYGEEAPAVPLKERYLLPVIGRLERLLHEKHMPAGLRKPLNHCRDKIIEKTDELRALAEQLRDDAPPGVLCHTDLHGWNLMWNGRLLLIDWEGLSLAPVEADLFSFTDGFFFDYAQEAFFSAYKKARPGYSVNEKSMAFYRLRRRLEDIFEFADSLAHDQLSETAASRSLFALQKECETLFRT